MNQPWASPFVFAVGLDTPPDATPVQIDEFNDFYTSTHLGEVLGGHPGMVCAARYALNPTAPPAPDNPGPQWLAVYGIADESSAQAFLRRATGPLEHRMAYTSGPVAWQRATLVWRMIWRRMATTGAGEIDAQRLSLIGMNPAPDASATETEQFDDFYTHTHLPEVVSGLGYDRGTRFELWHEFHHPSPGCPRFCASYEAGQANQPAPSGDPSPLRGPAPSGGATFSTGPRAWEERDVRWRLKYRRIG